MRPRRADCRTGRRMKVVGKQLAAPCGARDRLALGAARKKKGRCTPLSPFRVVSLSRGVLQPKAMTTASRPGRGPTAPNRSWSGSCRAL